MSRQKPLRCVPFHLLWTFYLDYIYDPIDDRSIFSDWDSLKGTNIPRAYSFTFLMQHPTEYSCFTTSRIKCFPFLTSTPPSGMLSFILGDTLIFSRERTITFLCLTSLPTSIYTDIPFYAVGRKRDKSHNIYINFPE